MSILRLDHVQLAYPPDSDDLARGFYIDILGFVEVPKPEPMRARGGMWLEAGPVAIHLGVEPGMRPSLKMHPALVVSLPVPKRGHTRDPFGNRIELIAGA